MNENIRVGSIVQWTGSSTDDIGVVLRISKEKRPYLHQLDSYQYKIYWFVEKKSYGGHQDCHFKVLVL